jgi:hypothetical protein
MTSRPVSFRRAAATRVLGLTLGLIGGGFAATAATAAPAGLDPVLFTVGTVTRDAQGRDWAYLVWQTTAPGGWPGRPVAVYRKPGQPDAPGPFTRQAIYQPQTDPTAVQLLLTRAVALGENPTELEHQVDELFGRTLPPGGLTLAQKIATLVRAASADPVLGQRLQAFARGHPGLNLCLGLAHAEPLADSFTTFEVREWDPTAGASVAVIGRVTLQAGQPLVLPPPGAPVVVRERAATGALSAKGHLNIKLRWATPDALRRLGLMNFGFHVFRVEPAFARARGWDTNRPDRAAFLAAAAAGTAVRRVTSGAVLPPKEFTAADVADFTADPATYFFADDNQRASRSDPPFQNGDRFYYFIAASDPLGRAGELSAGTLAVACAIVPPPAPTGIRVVNDYAFDPVTQTPRQRLKVLWQQNDNAGPQKTVRYHVYRWASPDESQRLAAHPDAHRIRIVPHLDGASTREVLDDGPGAPAISPTRPGENDDAGKTYWYSVRAEDDGACEPNFSAPSELAWGVLRDRVGPEPPTGFLQTVCLYGEVEFVTQRLPEGQPTGTPDPDRALYGLVCTRTAREVAWAEFLIEPRNGAPFLVGRAYFSTPAAQDRVMLAHSARADDPPFAVRCRVGLFDGSTAETVFGAVLPPDQARTQPPVLEFAARALALPTAGADLCATHFARPAGTDTTLGVKWQFTLPPTSREWRVYRRVEEGPLTLLAQGLADFTQVQQITGEDRALPVAGAEVCYFAQVFDEHGNGSALVPLGCTQVLPPAGQLPVPLLAPLEPSGSAADPRLTVRWFCAPAGVERFELWLSDDTRNAPPTLAAEFSPNALAAPATQTVLLDGQPTLQTFNGAFATRAVGSPELGRGPLFTVTFPAVPGRTYVAGVRALGRQAAGDLSNAQRYQWAAPTPQPEVPWPARPLPRVNRAFHPGLGVRCFSNRLDHPVGVRIGTVFGALVEESNLVAKAILSIPPALRTPESFQFRDGPLPTGTPLLPVVLYRAQVASALFPNAAGDPVQVSPLIEQVAWQPFDYNSDIGGVLIRDPFIELAPESDAPGAERGMYLLDTSPVVSGARYRYLLVRLAPNGEVDQIIPAGEVEIP